MRGFATGSLWPIRAVLDSLMTMSHPTSRGIVVGLAVVAVLFALPMFATPDGFVSGDAWRENDWLNTRLFDMLARDTILRDGVFPLRSHLVGGGFPTLAHPSDGSWAPTLPVMLLFGHVLGTKLVLAAFLFLGGLGIFLLCRDVLRLSLGASGVAGGLMLVSGWAPSMVLVGFWNQVFSLLGPLILWCLLARTPRRLLLGGFLLAMLLQQGGHAFPALCVALGIAALAASAHDSRSGPTASLGLLLTTAPLAFATVLELPFLALLAVVGPVVLARHAPLRQAALPRLRDLSIVIATALSLGAARLTGLLYLDQLGGRYGHSLSRHDAWWFPVGRPFSLLAPHIGERGTESFRGGQFYESVGTLMDALLHRAPAEMPYRMEFGRLGSPMDFEYAWLGISWVGVLLVGLGLVAALHQRRFALLAVTGLAAAVCFGPNLPPDLHFLVIGGLPFAGDLAQPLKYWNVFLLLTLVLVAGVGVHGAEKRWRWAPVVLAAALVVPALQNREALREAFSQARPALPAVAQYEQVALIADLTRLADEPTAIAQEVESKRLREYRRAPSATGYDLTRAGVGLISWYGTLELPEKAIPDRWVTPEGESRANPHAPGPVWLEGQGEVVDWDIGANAMRARVRAPLGGVVMFDQEALGGGHDWLVGGGDLIAVRGLLGVRIAAAPEREVTLTYRPPLLRGGLLVSALSLLGWLLAFVAVGRISKAPQAEAATARLDASSAPPPSSSQPT